MFSPEELETLYYACAQAEMMFRHRANNSVCNRGNYTEAECREQMKRYREMHRQLEVLCYEHGCFDDDTPNPAVVNRPNQRWISTLPKV